MSDIAIRTEMLTRDFRSVRALDGLTLEVRAGSVFGFLGPNGSGKTTTIRLLLGLLEPSAGRAEVLGYDTRLQAGEIRRRAGALLEHSGLYERLSAEENLTFYARVWGLRDPARRARVHELLGTLGLADRRREPIGLWSRGMKQKLAIARVFLHHPAIVFLDEPTAGLDPVAAAVLRDELATLVRQDGLTVFLTTHNLAEAERLCATVGIVRRGALLAVGTPESVRAQSGGLRFEVKGRNFSTQVIADLLGRPEVAGVERLDGRAVISLRNPSDTAPLVRLMVDRGVEIEEVRKAQASLEEAFLALMEEQPCLQIS
jgi:ABC-2 type transport system ATP-binding protein